MMVFGMTRPGCEPRPTVREADTLTTPDKVNYFYQIVLSGFGYLYHFHEELIACTAMNFDEGGGDLPP